MIGELRKIYRELDRLLEAAGHGAISRTLAAAGLGESYVRDLRARLAEGRDERYDLAALLRILRALGVDRAVFFGQVYGSLDPIELTRQEARHLGEPPEIVARVRDFLRLEQWRPLAEVPEHVRRLDAHRYQDAREAGRFAHAELEEVVAGLRPPAWGLPLLAVYGSALRMTDDYDGAQQTLVTALELAEPTGEPSVRGDLLQRLAYVVADRCADYRRALELTERATVCHLRAGDLNSVGKTFVDCGMWRYKLGEPEEAVLAQQRALELLEPDEYQNRFSALVALGLYQRELGDSERAHEYASLAAELTPHIGPWLVANLQWLQARIAVDRGWHEEAEGLLREAIQVFLPTSAVAAALATTELVRALLLQERSGEAHETAGTMARFIVPLEERSPAAAAAVLDLLLCGQAGRGITMELIDRVAGTLEDERARPKERARYGR